MMPFDAMTMAAVRDDVHDWGHGGQIQRIVQPSAHTVALQIHSHGHTRWLVVSADARFARVGLTADRLAKAFATPSAFVMLLRKHLEGVRIADVVQVPHERLLRFVCGPPDRRATLVVEVMGKHSNVVLTAEERVLGALKLVTPRQSRVRPVLPGQPYTPPPPRGRDEILFGAGPRPDPNQEADAVQECLASVVGAARWSDALLGLLPGASPFLVEQICSRASVPPGAEVARDACPRVLEQTEALYGLYISRDWQPHTFRDTRGRLDVAAIPPVGMRDVVRESDIGEAVERVYGSVESRDALQSVRAGVLEQVERALASAERKLASLQGGLSSAGDADGVMQEGQLLLAYQWAVRPGADRLDIPELRTSIRLDPALTVQENAERLFRRYRKLRDAAKRLPGLIAEAEVEAARLLDLRAFVSLADSESALRELQRQASPPPVGHKERHPTKRKGPPRLRRGDVRVVLGRNARENEEVTFRVASRDDVWFHARERTGSHVVASAALGELDDESLGAIAALAAHHSEGRNDTAVDVDIALVRDVRKIPGGPPGRVTYRNFTTLRVTPSADGWGPA